MSGVESGVTQADRQAAARIVEAADRYGAATIRAGEWDHHVAVIVCAAHRQAAYAAGRDAERGKSAAMLEALRAADKELAAWKHTAWPQTNTNSTDAALTQIRAAIAAAGGE